jgi:membrane protease YdiL (CAAX protease family)
MSAVQARAPDLLAAVEPGESRVWRVLAVVLAGGGLAFLASLVVSVLALVVAALVFVDPLGGSLGAAVEALLSARGGRPLTTYLAELATIGLGFAAALAVFLLVASRIHRRPVLSFLTAADRFRWRAVAAGFLVAAPLLLAVIGVEGMRSPPPEAGPLLSEETTGAKLAYTAGAVVFLFLAAFAEEAVFRGWALQQTRAFTRRRWVILLVPGLLFSLGHADPNPDAFLVRAAMGVAWGWIALRTGGVEFTTGAHLANNLLIALLLTPITLEAPKPLPFNAVGLGLELVVLAALIAVVEVARRRPALGRRLGMVS